jgi:cytochrome oxidase Cu insertion factor (SCO1/SenC/PrrC family)
MDLLICVIANDNKPSFVDYQYECFKKFIKGKFEYILFDNSNNSIEFKRHCDYIGAFYVKVQDILYQDLSNFILDKVYNLMKYRGTMLICNLDIFLTDHFELNSRLTNTDILSINNRHNIFNQNDFLVVNLKKLNISVDSINDTLPSMLQEYIKQSNDLVFENVSVTDSDNFSGCKIYEKKFLKYDTSLSANDKLFEFLCQKLIAWNINSTNENKYIISFSLYGNNPRYTHNAIMNALFAQRIYNGWICRFYYDHTVPSNIIDVLKSLKNTELVRVDTGNSSASAEKMFWRFYPASEEDVAAMIVRDADAWISFREAFLVKKWLESDKMFHIVRDHCHHTYKIMGGIWGIKRGRLPQLKELSENQAKHIKMFGADQDFMSDNIYPSIIDSSMIHVTNGYSLDRILPFERYPKLLEYIPGIDIEQTNEANALFCNKCNKVHPFFIGIQLFNLHTATKELLSKYGL